MKLPSYPFELSRIFIVLFLVLAANSTLVQNCLAKPKPGSTILGDYYVSAIVVDWNSPPIQTYQYELGVKKLRLLRDGRYIAYCLPRDKNNQPVEGKIRALKGRYAHIPKNKQVAWLSGPMKEFSPNASYESAAGKPTVLTFNYELVYVTCTRRQ